MDRLGPAQGLGAHLGQTQVTDLARGDQLGHRADGLLDRHPGVAAVQVVQVDVVDAEPAQRGVARLPDVLGTAVDGPRRRVVTPDDAELGRQYRPVPAVGDRPPDQFLVVAPAVHVGGVQEVHPEIQRPVDDLDRLGLVGRAVELRHSHAAEPECGDLGAAAAETSLVHEFSIA
nr:hypothetical protein GCM10020093_051650 [Planobispora longispora]